MTQPTPMDGYVEAIERWAEYKGVTIAEWHVDEDETGGAQERLALSPPSSES